MGDMGRMALSGQPDSNRRVLRLFLPFSLRARCERHQWDRIWKISAAKQLEDFLIFLAVMSHSIAQPPTHSHYQ